MVGENEALLFNFSNKKKKKKLIFHDQKFEIEISVTKFCKIQLCKIKMKTFNFLFF